MSASGASCRGEVVHRLWCEQQGLFRGFIVDVVTAEAIGATIVIGGRGRTHTAAWEIVNANGGPGVWGTVLVLLGILLGASVYGGRLWVMWALWGLALFYLVLGLAFALSVYRDPAQGSSFVGTLLMLRCMFMHVSRAQVYRDGVPEWTE